MVPQARIRESMAPCLTKLLGVQNSHCDQLQANICYVHVDETAVSEAGYELAEFAITFSYPAQGQTYQGTYKAGSPEEEGHTFEILFDPSNPGE
jgi:hypothetical protein